MPSPYATGSTVLSVLVPEAEPLVAGHRTRHDLAASYGMPAHVTVLYPWLPEGTIAEEDLAALERIAQATAPFDARLERTGRFPRTVWLEPNPVEAFRALTHAVWGRWPEAAPYEGAYDYVQPHLTVADGQPEPVLAAVEADLAPRLPVALHVDAVALHAFDGTRWAERRTFPLGPPPGRRPGQAHRAAGRRSQTRAMVPPSVASAGPTGPSGERDDAASATSIRRRRREAEIVAATRGLFDARGVRDAQVEDIARAAKVNRAILYRHFTGKEELFALTLVTYLDELRGRLLAAEHEADDPAGALAALVDAFVTYGSTHPAFVDCAQALMGRTGTELLEELSETALVRLGRAITGCLGIVRGVLERGSAAGVFTVEDPVLLANTLYASGLGTLQLARVGLLVDEDPPGRPTVGRVGAEQVRDFLVTSALAVATAPRRPAPS